ncbi:hypothetical protein [Candidatus Odyssella acanthamoebae]|uniref:Methyltransferase type 11 domain-containing protein n=1 Tax=Candidatus Odyssella acanthamoebae TaxID=91604 RepID=A0A077AUE2_9PROT|nr:hypothetical protein [Candidatus Paracaedibacter acanthamoebae]AIK96807.1 hypothetical protein ID47_08805 [Candidatus Paracaedibacter acanthamoebae]
MYKKNILAVMAMSIAQLGGVSAQQNAYRDSSAFNPENTHFSQLDTIKTWVADKHYDEVELMSKLQQNVAMTVPQNPFSLHFMLPVKNNPEDKRYFGKSFRTLAAVELPFLQYVKQLSAEREITTLEIAASIGMVSVKVPFAFGHKGTHYVNDLSAEMLNNEFQKLVNSRLGGTALKEHLKILPADCFHLLEQEPSLRNKVDAIYVQNLEHFFNPVQHQLFLSVLDDLLAENGQAFLCAHSFKFGIDTSHPLFKLYSSRKSEGDVYPGFAAYDVEFTGIYQTQATLGNPVISKVSRPSDDTEIKKIDIGTPRMIGSEVVSPMGRVELFKMKQHITENSFSPSIYRNAVALHPHLEVTDAFFMDGNGNRIEKWGKDVTHAVAIVKKKTSVSIEE